MSLEPRYRSSWALVIGINSYQHVAPLGYARLDAEAVCDLLISQLGFPHANVTLLCDDRATAQAIRAAFFGFTKPPIGPNDRVFVFFAGHGHTTSGHRGEVGYLVPVDGRPNELETLLRWDDLTRNADLILAKHVLFVMDACYGGLAVTRALQPGSMRFLRDMLMRHSRQVLTAGKANEVVSDAGGPRPGHSVFTGHFLDALENTSPPDGIITANGVMAYVYDRVAKDQHSHQSPHYGFLDGDGDFVFKAPGLIDPPVNSEEEVDVLVPVPPTLTPQPFESPPLAELLKDYLADPSNRIRLDDLVNIELRKALADLDPTLFPLQATLVDATTVKARLDAYSSATSGLAVVVTLLSRWGSEEHMPALARILTRLADLNPLEGGLEVWLALRWYPLCLLIHYGGIAALNGNNAAALRTLFRTRVISRPSPDGPWEVVDLVTDGITGGSTDAAFKLLPGHERHLVPRSEYLLKELQPLLDELLFLGRSYEDLFDRLEVLVALAYMDSRFQADRSIWGPLGRFAYKYRRHRGGAFADLIAEVPTATSGLLPLRAGLFGGSPERLREIVSHYQNFLGTIGGF